MPACIRNNEVCSKHMTNMTNVFCGLWGHSIGVMVFILYKAYFYRPTPTLHLNLPLTEFFCILTFTKNSFCIIYKPFEIWNMRKCPPKSLSPCNIYVIPMSLYKFVSSCHKHTTHTHTTHTHTHTHTHSFCVYYMLYVCPFISVHTKKNILVVCSVYLK